MSTANGSPSAANQQSSTDRALTSIGELGENPLALVAGGVALGVLVGMLLPRLDKERELLDPLGRTLADRATAAAQAAKEAGKQELESLLPSKDSTKDRVTALFGSVLDAAKDAAQKA